MIVILKENPDPQQLENLTRWLKSMNLGIHVSEGAHEKILGLIGDTTPGNFEIASRVPSTVSHFKTESGTSLESL